MASLIQSPWLGMIALGDNTMIDPNKGNHLRWAFESHLGFPDGGFDLYRRTHFTTSLVCVTLQGFTTNQNLGRRLILGNLLLESTADIMTVELVAAGGAPEIDLRNKPPFVIWLREVCHRVRVYVVDRSPSGGTIQASAYDRNVLVSADKTMASPNVQFLDLAADRIDRVVIRGTVGAMNGVLTQVCYTTIAADASAASPGWTRLNQTPICLPLSDSKYPTASKPANSDLEWPAAQRRIPKKVGDDEVWARYDPPKFTDLRDTLSRIYSPADLTSNDISAPKFVHDPLQIVLLTTLDPYIARMVGLYWIDGAFYVERGLQGPPAATVGTAYDYMVTAHYPQRAEPVGTCDTWDANDVGKVINGAVPHGPLCYTSPVALSVVVHNLAEFSTVQALSIPGNIGNPLRINLLKPAQAIELYLDVPNANARAFARAFFKGVEVDATLRSASNNGPTTLLLTAEAIDTVELEGSNIFLAKICYYTNRLPSGDMSFIVYNVTLGVPPTLPPPLNLRGDALPVLTHLAEDGNPVTGQMAVGLRWDPNPAGDSNLPIGTMLYDIERQDLGSGNAAAATKPTNWKIAKLNLLVGAPSPESQCEPYEPLPGWPSAPPYYIDVPPSNLPLKPQSRFYAFRIRGTDIFGRKSVYRESAPLELKDTIPPPPPADVHAKYLDPDDPYLSPDERNWTHPDSGPRHGLRVGWRWSKNLQQQAPDATQFRVYLKTGRLNVVVGNITAVGELDANDNVQLTTDVTTANLPAGNIAHAFRGEWLSQGLNLYEVVDSGAASGFLILTIHREKWEPPPDGEKKIKAPELAPIPTKSAFSLSVRPPQPLAGMITVAGWPDLERRIVDTNVRYSGAANDLAGKKLRQAGCLWNITGNTTGSPFQIFLQARACDPDTPAQGQQFAVMETDGVTPIMLDAGNPHWQDYRDPGYWGQPLQVEPITDIDPGHGKRDGRINARIGSWTLHDDGASTVVAGRPLDDPLGHYLGGVLQMTIDVLVRARDGQERIEPHDVTWPVIGLTPGDNFQLTVLNYRRDLVNGLVERAPRDDEHDPIPPPVTGSDFTYWPDIVIPIEALEIAPGEAAAYAAVAVNTEDQTGNMGVVSSPQIIVSVDRRSPPSWPPITLTQGWATSADFLGRSSFTLRWPRLTGSGSEGLRYQVGRALEDRRDPVDPLDATQHPPAEERYWLLTPEALRPQDAPDKLGPGHSTVDPNLMAYDDALDGKSSSRYYYRVRAMTAAGRLGAWSDPVALVACPDVVPPRPPTITKVLGGDRRITLRWAKNREPDFLEYRVYRTTNKEATTDLRLMERVPIDKMPLAACTDFPGEVCWTDIDRPGMVIFYYRLVAVDDSGNVSKPSPVITGRAYDNSRPEPPAWNPAQAGQAPDSVVLSWTSPNPNLRCLVQRLEDAAPIWKNASGWLDRGVYTYTDEKRATGVQYVYRLRVLDAAGKMNETYNELTA